MFLSVVSSKSNPASSATVSKSPFLNLSQPCWAAVRTVWLERRTDRNRRCLIEKNPHLLRNLRRVSGWLIETAGGEFDHRLHLFPVQPIEPFHNVVDIGPGFQIFEDSGHRHPGTLQNPCPAHFARDAFDGGTLRPIESAMFLPSSIV